MKEGLRRWAWVWIPLAFLVTTLGWGLTSPVGAAPDDDYHLASIWCGLGEREGACVDPDVTPATRLVPAPVVQSAVCYAFKADVTADCQEAILASTDLAGTQHINQIDGLYPGAYYQVMSLLVGPDVERSVLVMRLVNALLAAVLLAALLRLLPAGLAAAATLAVVVTFVPLGLSLVASTNPSSWSIIGIGTFWAFALAFLRRPSVGDRRGVLIAAAMVVSAVMAIAARVDSAAYVAVTAVVVVTLTGWRLAGARPWRLALVAGLAVAGLLTYFNRGQALTGGEQTLGTADAGIGLLLTNVTYLPLLVQGIVGGWNLGWNDVVMPPLVPVVGVLALGALAYRGLQEARPRKLWAATLALAALVAVPVAYLQSQRLGVGEVVQPRYLLPLLTLLVGVLCLGPRLRTPLPFPSVPRAVLLVALSASSVLAYWAYAHRFAAGANLGLFDPEALTLSTSGAGLPAWLTTLVVATATVVLVTGVLVLNDQRRSER
jgi:hypothetical protein